MPTLQQIDDELERRELIASIQGGATPTEPKRAGPTPAQGAESSGFLEDTLDVAQEFGSGLGRSIAKGLDVVTYPQQTILGNLGRLTGVMKPDEYLDITDATDEVLSGGQMDPGTARDMVAGAGELVPEVAAMATPIGLSGALALKGARALGKVGEGAAGLRGARAAAAKPRVTVRGGQVVDDVPARMGRLEATAKGAGVGALLGDDAVEGGLTGAAAINLLFNTPAGRVFTLAMSRKMGGEKFTTAAWHSMNPQNRAKLWELFKSFKKGAK